MMAVRDDGDEGNDSLWGLRRFLNSVDLVYLKLSKLTGTFVSQPPWGFLQIPLFNQKNPKGEKKKKNPKGGAR